MCVAFFIALCTKIFIYFLLDKLFRILDNPPIGYQPPFSGY